MRILVIEDDITLQQCLKDFLEHETFAVDSTSKGTQGSYLARTNNYDLIILDNMLPEKSGDIICREIREAKKEAPILLISMLDSFSEQQKLLYSGADQYLAKPFSFEQLLLHVHVLLRRPKLTNNDTITIGTLTLNTKTKQVLKGKRFVHFTRKEYALFEYLMRHAPSIVPRNTLLEQVWDNEVNPFSNTVEAHIRSIKNKISTKKRPYIYNIPGRGYKIDTRN